MLRDAVGRHGGVWPLGRLDRCVPRHTFSAVLGAVTAAGRDNADTFQYFRPGFDLAAERTLRGAGRQKER